MSKGVGWVLRCPQDSALSVSTPWSMGHPSFDGVVLWHQLRDSSFLFYFIICLFFFGHGVFCSCCPGWSAMVRSQLTSTSAPWVQAILLPQLPELLGLQARATVPS